MEVTMKKRSIFGIVLLAALFAFASPVFAEDTFATTCPNCPPMVEPPVVELPNFPVITIDTDCVNNGGWVASAPFQNQNSFTNPFCEMTMADMFQNLQIAGQAGTAFIADALANESQYMKRTETVPNGENFFTGVQGATIYGAVSPTSTQLNLDGQQFVDGKSQTESFAFNWFGKNIWSATGENNLDGQAVLVGYGQNLYGSLQQQALNGYQRTYGDPAGSNYSWMSAMSNISTNLLVGAPPTPQD